MLSSLSYNLRSRKIVKKNSDDKLVIIVKIEKYIEYMLTILIKIPRTEKLLMSIKKSFL